MTNGYGCIWFEHWQMDTGWAEGKKKVIGRKYSIWKKTCTIKHIIIFKWKGHLRFLNGSFKMIGNNGRISPLFIYKGISITKLLNVRVQKALINKLILTFYNRSHFLWIVSIRNYFNNLTVFFFSSENLTLHELPRTEIKMKCSLCTLVHKGKSCRQKQSVPLVAMQCIRIHHTAAISKEAQFNLNSNEKRQKIISSLQFCKVAWIDRFFFFPNLLKSHS